MDQEYKRKVDEAARFDRDRRENVKEDGKRVNVPNLERMPFGCLLLMVAVVVGLYFLFRGCGS